MCVKEERNKKRRAGATKGREEEGEEERVGERRGGLTRAEPGAEGASLG